MTQIAPRPTRRALLLGAAAATATATAAPAEASTRFRHEHGRLPIRGADLSFTLQLEEAGARFSYRGRTAPVERIMAAAGANWMRLRVWVDPPNGESTLRSAIVLGRRARRAGMKVLLDLHYSDTWADPGHQATPAAWAGQDLHQLARTVRSYTRNALETMARAGAPVDMVQIGNEITTGMLWPLGQVYATDTPDWEGFTTLLRAGISGAREARVRGRSPQVMVHIDRGGDNAGSRYFFDHVLEHGVDFDVIGQSYYPFWHGSLDDLRANLVDLADRYGKDLVVVETAYPWTLDNGDDLTNLINSAAQLPDVETWPPTPQGQLAYYEALRSVLLGIPRHRGLGFFSWEPEWIPGVGWTTGEGNPNDNLTLFDFQGRALPALRAFRPA